MVLDDDHFSAATMQANFGNLADNLPSLVLLEQMAETCEINLQLNNINQRLT